MECPLWCDWYCVWPLWPLDNVHNANNVVRLAALALLVLGSVAAWSWKPLAGVLVLALVVALLAWYTEAPCNSARSRYRQRNVRAACDNDSSPLPPMYNCQTYPFDGAAEAIRRHGFVHPANVPRTSYAPYSSGDVATDNPIVSEANTVGNPMTYDYYTAVNMSEPRRRFYPQQGWAELWRPNGEVPEGLWLNPVADQTRMALPAVQFPRSSEEERSILQAMGTGYWGPP